MEGDSYRGLAMFEDMKTKKFSKTSSYGCYGCRRVGGDKKRKVGLRA